MAACPVLVSSGYIERHNMVARVMHWHLCKFFNVPLSSNIWFSHDPLPVVENKAVKMLWNFGVFTNIRISNNRTDIVVFMK